MFRKSNIYYEHEWPWTTETGIITSLIGVDVPVFHANWKREMHLMANLLRH